jgi:hypothetical protein
MYIETRRQASNIQVRDQQATCLSSLTPRIIHKRSSHALSYTASSSEKVSPPACPSPYIIYTLINSKYVSLQNEGHDTSDGTDKAANLVGAGSTSKWDGRGGGSIGPLSHTLREVSEAILLLCLIQDIFLRKGCLRSYRRRSRGWSRCLTGSGRWTSTRQPQ